MNRPGLSLCLIFRDEEAMLPDFLAAVEGLWDEFIAVDTGSRDGSAELLRRAGARLVDFPWVDDFAAARNASLEAAGGRWILFLDADERVSPELAAQIRSLLTDDEAGAATVVMRNRLPGGHGRESRLLRLFHNQPDIRFRYRIHEDVAEDVHAYLERQGLALRHLSGVVEHLGYVREVAADRAKKERDLGLLRLSLEQDPRDFYCRYKVLEIARFWEDLPLWRAEAGATASLLATLSPDEVADLRGRHWSGELAGLVAAGLDLPARRALDWLEGTSAWARPTASWFLHRGLLEENLEMSDEAARDFSACLERQSDPEEGTAQLTGVRPLLGLCRLALKAGQGERAAELATRAAQAGPLDPEALLALLTIGPADLVLQRALDHLRAHPAAAQPLAETALGLGRVPVAAAALRHGLRAEMPATQQPDLALGLLVCTLVLGEDFDVEIQADQEQADALLRRWVRHLWQSRRTEALAAFAENCQAITGIFPWLPAFLTEVTDELKGEAAP